MSEKSKRRLQELKSLDQNSECGECMAPGMLHITYSLLKVVSKLLQPYICALVVDPQYASYSIGIFLCEKCCGCHRMLGTHLSKTKSLTIDSWDSDQVKVSV